MVPDHLGTPKYLVDENQTVVWDNNAKPFGNSTPDQDPDGDGQAVELNHRFPGQYYDEETGLHYNYFRYYDPELGRYITSDPIGLYGGMNTYAYAYQNPVIYVDPYGLWVLTFGVSGEVTIGKGGALGGGFFFDSGSSTGFTDAGLYGNVPSANGFNNGGSLDVDFYPNGGRENIDNPGFTRNICILEICFKRHYDACGNEIGYGGSIGAGTGGFSELQNNAGTVSIRDFFDLF